VAARNRSAAAGHNHEEARIMKTILNRRRFLSTAFGACAVARVTTLFAQVTPGSGALTKER